MSILQPTTEARLLAAARARGEAPDEIVAALLDRLPAEAPEADLLKEISQGFPKPSGNATGTLSRAVRPAR